MIKRPGVAEFTCCECGAHIVRLDGVLPEPLLCATCLFVPGWTNNPELVVLFERLHISQAKP